MGMQDRVPLVTRFGTGRGQHYGRGSAARTTTTCVQLETNSFVFFNFLGSLASLRHHKEEVESIAEGVECGLMFNDNSVEPQPGDTVVCFQIVKVPQKLDWELFF